MNENLSRKHHYLPRHYLEGFVNDKSSFFMYDKVTDRIFTSSPDHGFHENELNTVKIREKSDLIES